MAARLARGEADGPGKAGRQAVVAAGQEAAGADQREGQADPDGDAIEEGKQGLARAAQIQRGGGDREQQAAVGGTAGVQDGPPGPGGDRRGGGAQGLEQVTAQQRRHVRARDGVRGVSSRGAVAGGQAQRQRGAQDGRQRRELKVVGRAPGGEAVAGQPGEQHRSHGRLFVRKPSGPSTHSRVARRRPRPGATRQFELSSGGGVQLSSVPSPPEQASPWSSWLSQPSSLLEHASSSSLSQLSPDDAQLSAPAPQPSREPAPLDVGGTGEGGGAAASTRKPGMLPSS